MTQLHYTDHFALLYPAINNFRSQFISQNLLLVDSSPSRSTAHNTNIWAEQGLLRLLVFIVARTIGRAWCVSCGSIRVMNRRCSTSDI